ncbi:MAG: tRNA-dihydrouridine synthase family protein [Clostridia bacterium]|nr:tRNA-dihydrouridine synthase family protein [Clostridia bacterium]
MKIEKLKLNNKILNSNIFLAPMAGYTDYAFRSNSKDLGYGLMFTELVSAKGLFYGGQNTKDLLKNDGENTAVQLFGADAFYLRKACESEDLKDFDVVDINMGCPVPKVYKNGEGSALLTDIKKAESIVKECVKSGKTITVKIRTGIKKGDDVASEFSKMAEDSGASLITIHGRVRDDYYSGEPDYKAIEKAKSCVKIPVIANGGIFTEKDADKMIENTGADGIMLARGAIQNPFLVCDLLNKKSHITLKQFVISQLEKMQSQYGEKRANLEFKKFVSYYFKGGENIKSDRIKIMNSDSIRQTISLIEEMI